MKNIIKTTILSTALFASASLFAGDAKVVALNKKAVNVTVNNISETLSIRLFDNYGKNIYANHFKNDLNYASTYDLSSLPSGVYYLEVEDGSTYQKFEVTVSPIKVEVTKLAEEKVFEPSVRIKENLLFVNMFSLNRERSALVNVADKENTIVLSERLIGTNNFGKIYDLSSLPKGEYELTVTSGGKEVVKSFTK